MLFFAPITAREAAGPVPSAEVHPGPAGCRALTHPLVLEARIPAEEKQVPCPRGQGCSMSRGCGTQESAFLCPGIRGLFEGGSLSGRTRNEGTAARQMSGVKGRRILNRMHWVRTLGLAVHFTARPGEAACLQPCRGAQEQGPSPGAGVAVPRAALQLESEGPGKVCGRETAWEGPALTLGDPCPPLQASACGSSFRSEL